LQFTPTESQKFVFEYGKNNQEHTLTPGDSLDAWTMRGNLKQPNSKRETHNSRSHWVAAWNAQGEILHPEIAVYQEKVIREVKSGKKDKYNHWDLNYESRKPEITNTIIDAKVTAFLP
ncbi:TPA: TonB-dependent receptor, partial [Escherichia coli]|nr:TonB-dependent receptor [Escherichia coli O146]